MTRTRFLSSDGSLTFGALIVLATVASCAPGARAGSHEPSGEFVGACGGAKGVEFKRLVP